MPDDAELLREYAEDGSEAAFAALVQRRVDLVYSVALRSCGGDAHRAGDVTQRVFTDLARKAAVLSRRPVLSGWLYRSAQFAAADLVRSDRRRRAREEEAHIMHETSYEPARDADWEKLRPVLDDVMGELVEADRDAVMLRFFEGRAFREIGAALRLTEDAARMRVERALGKLHAALKRRGVTSTSAALGVALANQASVAAPTGMAASVASAALAGVVAPGILGFMSTAKIVTGAAVIVMGMAIGIGINQNSRRRAAEQSAAVARQEQAALHARLATSEARAQRAERRAEEAERDSGELLKAVGALRAKETGRIASERPGATAAVTAEDMAEATRLYYERTFQQDMATRRQVDVKTVKEIMENTAQLDPAAKYQRLIEMAAGLATQGRFQLALRMFNLAMTAKPAEVPLSDDVRQLQATLTEQSRPVTVSLRSDRTYLIIAGFRAVGFGYNNVPVLPGDYEVIGLRQGYQEVKLPLRVRQGETPPSLEVACTVPAPP